MPDNSMPDVINKRTNPLETAVMAGLFIAVSTLAVAMPLLGTTEWIESIAFVTGAVCVWLVVKQNIWNFPLGLVNVAIYCVVYFKTQLFADAGLQVVYFVLQLIGWYLWLRGSETHSELKVARATTFEVSLLLVFVAASTIGLWQLLQRVGGSASFWDAFTTSISLASQWLLNRKRVENWIGWIVVDIIYVPLYVYKELYLTAILYAIFLTMAVMGLRAWRASWLLDRRTGADVLLARAEVS